ncbi:MAG: hypothetical protein DRR19_06530 [Candidatus Parabeggiatoa sp. nov. 1]|nr:MAG: hypothetical protein DRR19_06530 [Gammaproteobacteria bacterium]
MIIKNNKYILFFKSISKKKVSLEKQSVWVSQPEQNNLITENQGLLKSQRGCQENDFGLKIKSNSL